MAKSVSVLAKEKQLEEKIRKAKEELEQLKKKRIEECGKLMAKYQLDRVDNSQLEPALAKLAKELVHDHAD